MLDLELIPEKSISNEKWQIILGMSLYQVIQILKSNCDTIKSVQMIYNDKDPLSSDYMLNLNLDGIVLYFDSSNQRLKLIEINDLKKLKLKYYGNYFNNLPTVQPTFDQITETFGITSPGIYDNNSSVFLLHFPGLFFTFSIDFRVEPKHITHHGIQSLQFPTGRTPLVTKISIYSGTSPSAAMAPEMPSLCLSRDIIYGSKLTVLRDYNLATKQGFTKGISLSLFTQGLRYQLDRENFDAEIMFNDTCQDVMSSIGSPNSVFYKSEELNKSGAIQSDPSLANDYFYNYRTLGFDLLFNSSQNRVAKFILHSNFPCHYNFNSYFMCNFEIPILVNPETNQTFIVTPATTLEKLQENLSIKTQPAILHRSSSTNSVNPFGPAFFYIYEDIIFEVMTNGCIAS
ncbi:unnamed protein product, partial [Brachionus calyciflorus]